MPIYTLAVADRAILAFSGKDTSDALAFAAHDFIRAELASLRAPDGLPLWNGMDDLTVRQATAPERAVWEADIPHAIRDQVTQSREQALIDGHFVFLVDYRDPDE